MEFSISLSIDEFMVPYNGHHGAKMFIRGNPVRFDYKVWMLCGSDGHPYQVSIYCEKSDRPENRNFGEHVVLEFANMLPDKTKKQLFLTTFLFLTHCSFS